MKRKISMVYLFMAIVVGVLAAKKEVWADTLYDWDGFTYEEKMVPGDGGPGQPDETLKRRYTYTGPGGIVTIPDGVEFMGGDSGFGTPILWVDGLRLNSNIFEGRDDITEVVLPESVKNISLNIFQGSKGNITLKITGSKTDIVHWGGSYPSLIAIEVGSNNQRFSSYQGVLYNKERTKFLHCPGGAEVCVIPADYEGNTDNGGFDFTKCSKLKKFIVEDGSEYYSSEDGVLYDKTQSNLLVYPAGKEDVSFQVPETITRVGAEYSNLTGKYNAFCGNKYIKSVLFPNSITWLNQAAFRNCTNLEEVKLSNSLVCIKSLTFENCTSLKEIIIPESVETIFAKAFWNCTNLKKATIQGTQTEMESEGENELSTGCGFENCPNLTIRGYDNSKAKESCAKWGIPFQSLDEEPDINEPDVNDPDDSSDSKVPYAGTWQLDTKGWWILRDDGTYPANQWEEINGEWYAFDKFGYMRIGWYQDGGTWYYLSSSGAMVTGWMNENNTWYYLSGNGAMVTGWMNDEQNWYYLSGNGSMVTGWYRENRNWYFLSGSGAMATGWYKDNRSWYYLSGNGSMATGWMNDGQNWYYLNGNGSIVTGWYRENGNWYFLSGSGAMVAGWYNDNGAWYLLGGNGAMVTGWYQDNGAWYYLNKNGVMVTGWYKDGGTWYYLGGNGAMSTGWISINGTWYFLDSSGAMVTGWIEYEGKWYYLTKNGTMAINSWVDVFYVDGSGTWIMDIG